MIPNVKESQPSPAKKKLALLFFLREEIIRIIH